jgi:beta-N-acetylhexosaminidase
MVLINHASYPAITRDPLPASLSRYWITDILRKKIGYRGLIVSDDLEMGGVLKAARLDEAASQFIGAGGDLCLICHEQALIEQAYGTMLRKAERDARFRRRVIESVQRIAVFKKKSRELKRRTPAPSPEKISRLSTQLWEFSEQVRLQALSVAPSAGARRL